MMSHVTIFVFLAILTQSILAQAPFTPHKQYAEMFYGAEVISPDQPPLSYISNLRYDDVSGAPRIWYTADKSTPNIYFAEFDPTRTDNHAFWTTAVSPFAKGKASPYMAMDVLFGNIAGVAYPSGMTTGVFGLQGDAQIFQGAYVKPKGNGPLQLNQSQAVDYEFYGVSFDRNGANSSQYLYMAGWAHDLDSPNMGFSVGRAALRFDTSYMSFDQSVDVVPARLLEPNTGVQCYDVYTSNYRPYVWVKSPSQYILVVYPGPCSRIYKIAIPPAGQSMANANIERLDPVSTLSQYISSAAFDDRKGILWYSVKNYQLSAVEIRAVNLTTFTPLPMSHVMTDMGIHEPILTLANDKLEIIGEVYESLIISASGMNIVKRYIPSPDYSSLQFVTAANLHGSFNKVSSTLYVSPFFYFSTYEPDAKLVRIHLRNFCAKVCGNNSFCNQGTCQCAPDYTPDPTNKDAYGNPTCVPGYYREIERQVSQQTGATAALATLLAFSIVIGLAGWYLWWKARHPSA